MKIILISIFILILSTATFAKDARTFFNNKTKIKDPFSLRDPFKSPLKRVTTKKVSTKKSIVRDGVYTNYFRPTLATTKLSAIKIIGIVVGENRRAICQIEGFKDNVILKEGEKVGPDKAVLKAILPGGVVFVEKITNVYGQQEYLETVIPISK